jgi:hypothetical protein
MGNKCHALGVCFCWLWLKSAAASAAPYDCPSRYAYNSAANANSYYAPTDACVGRTSFHYICPFNTFLCSLNTMTDPGTQYAIITLEYRCCSKTSVVGSMQTATVGYWSYYAGLIRDDHSTWTPWRFVSLSPTQLQIDMQAAVSPVNPADSYTCPTGIVGIGFDSTNGAFRMACPYCDTTCVPCPAGSYCVAPNDPVPCPIGNYCPSGVSSPVQCDRNRFSAGTGAAACDWCGGGTYTISLGATVCVLCSIGKAGQAAATGKVYDCPLCLAGTYASREGQAACTLCALGMYIGSTGQSACSLCAKGKSAPQEGLSACPQCGYGTYSDVTGATTCTACPPTTFGNGLGLTACATCAVGFSTQTQGQAACAACAPLSVANAHFVNLCNWMCNVGYFSSVSGLNPSQCVQCKDSSLCNPGQYRPLCTDGVSDTQGCTGQCIPGNEQVANVIWISPSRTNEANGCDWGCPSGKYKDAVTNTCRCCAVHYLQPNQNLIDAQCASYQNNMSCRVGQFPQGQCLFESGTASYRTAPVCTDCLGVNNAVLTSSGSAGNPSSCQFVCNYGFFTPPGSLERSCQAWKALCPAGSAWSPGTATTDAQCTPCTQANAVFSPDNTCNFVCMLGYELVVAAAAANPQGICQACYKGKYRNLLTLTSCVQCPGGKYTDNTGMVNCLAAPVNGWSSASGDAFVCNAGYASGIADLGAGVCSTCKAGEYAQSSVCLACPGGTFNAQSMAAISVCTNCSAGSYTFNVNQTACMLCMPGYYSTGTGAKLTCDGCAPGTYSAAAGATACTLCALGKYAGTPGCTGCSAGIADCNAGYAWVAGTSTQDATCTPCKYYNDTRIYLYVHNLCTYKCIDGYQVDASSNNTGACVLCVPGKFKDNQLGSNTFCTQCTAGTYQSGSAVSVCVNCGAGTFTSATGVTTSALCERCKRGMYAPAQAATVCLACSVGTYSTNYSSTTCLACAPGWTCGRGSTYCYPSGSKTAFYNQQAPPACQMVTDWQASICGV